MSIETKRPIIRSSCVNLVRRLGYRIVRNLHPKPQRDTGAPGSIGILENKARKDCLDGRSG